MHYHLTVIFSVLLQFLPKHLNLRNQLTSKLLPCWCLDTCDILIHLSLSVALQVLGAVWLGLGN